MSLIIDETNGLIHNKVLEASKLCLSTTQKPSAQRLKEFSVTTGKDRKILKTIEGVKLI